ncbi:hypothetical protein [uncultured Desulfovibrio sp.]|uniref:hypothetical protein n=1 Tax=uncultured Desulfovibrio sp. TaxID=167968 RepID=UPI0026167B17|nr:hypothetical protein [uncultured Desulfovibrio sp.]
MISDNLLEQTYNTLSHIAQGKGLSTDSTENFGDIFVFLCEDILSYLNNRRSFDPRHKKVWEESIKRRLEYFPEQVLTSLDIDPGEIKRLAISWKGEAKAPTYIPIKFGQMRIASHFASEETVQPKRIREAASCDIRTISVAFGHAFPIHVFYHNGNWIACNNRGLAAHCFAKIQPRRIIPKQQPDACEINRLNEIEGQNGVGTFHFATSVTLKIPTPRTLPSEFMPLTDGQNTWEVIDTTCIPSDWK